MRHYIVKGGDYRSMENGLVCSTEDDMTKQEFKDECDINTLVRRFALTGEIPQGIRMPTYGDFEGFDSYQDAVNTLAMANESFSAMPAEIRDRFANDPAKFVEFCSDERNLEEARRMGLVPAAELIEPPTAVVVPPVVPDTTNPSNGL